MRFILGLFFTVTLAHVLIAYNLPWQIYQEFFPFQDLLYKFYDFYPFTAYGNFDGYPYIAIAKHWYSDLQQSYFPLFPITIIAFAKVFFIKNYLVAAVFASAVLFLSGLFFARKLFLFLTGGNESITKWAIAFLVLFPTGFFYQVVYPESLYLFLSSAGLYFLFTKRYRWALIFGVLASLAKVQGVLLLLPYFLMIFAIPYQKNLVTFTKSYLLSIKRHAKLLIYACAPAYGILLYAGYLFISVGDPLYFYHTQAAFGAHRSVNTIVTLPQVLYRYIKIFITAEHDFIYWIAVLEFSIFLLVFSVMCIALYRLLRSKRGFDLPNISLQLYSLVVLILPTLTGTLTSVPRYALISLGFFVALAQIPNRYVKYSFAIVFSILQIVLFVYFLKGYFVS